MPMVLHTLAAFSAVAAHRAGADRGGAGRPVFEHRPSGRVAWCPAAAPPGPRACAMV